MKRNLFRVLVLLLTALLLLSSCSKLPDFAYADGAYVNEKSGASYLAAPQTYRARNYVENNPVAKIPQGKSQDMIIYSIDKTDSEKYLSNDEGQLFYNSTLTLPALWEMNVEQIKVFSAATTQYSLVSITDVNEIAAIIDAYQNGVHFSQDELELDLSRQRYDLEFASPDHLAFYYTLTYWAFSSEVLVYEIIESVEGFSSSYAGIEVTFETFEDETYAVYHFGKHLLFDRVTGECYPIGDTITKYLN
ncbi:MAG: hypothetical protein IKJ35_06450 [Clostridia bacterium]|nr:hypothetical protein [Clostridia bacterium]